MRNPTAVVVFWHVLMIDRMGACGRLQLLHVDTDIHKAALAAERKRGDDPVR